MGAVDFIGRVAIQTYRKSQLTGFYQVDQKSLQ